jgi:hypothetical protein
MPCTKEFTYLQHKFHADRVIILMERTATPYLDHSMKRSLRVRLSGPARNVRLLEKAENSSIEYLKESDASQTSILRLFVPELEMEDGRGWLEMGCR